MEQFIARQALRIWDFKQFVLAQSEYIKTHARAGVEAAQRAYVHLGQPVGKENRVREMLRRDPVTDGLVAFVAAVEDYQLFDVISCKCRPRQVLA